MWTTEYARLHPRHSRNQQECKKGPPCSRSRSSTGEGPVNKCVQGTLWVLGRESARDLRGRKVGQGRPVRRMECRCQIFMKFKEMLAMWTGSWGGRAGLNGHTWGNSYKVCPGMWSMRGGGLGVPAPGQQAMGTGRHATQSAGLLRQRLACRFISLCFPSSLPSHPPPPPHQL